MKRILINESSLVLLSEGSVVKRLFPLAEKIFDGLKNGKNSINYPKEALKKYGIDRPMHIQTCALPGDAVSVISEEVGAYGMYYNLKVDMSKSANGMSDNFFQTKIVHELAHLGQNLRNLEPWKHSGMNGKRVEDIYYLFCNEEIHARIYETYSFFYHNPRGVVDIIKRHINDGNLVVKECVSDMITQSNGSHYLTLMGNYMSKVNSDTYSNGSLVVIMVNDARRGCKLMGSIPRRVDSSNFNDVKQQILEAMKRKCSMMTAKIASMLGQLVMWYVNKFFMAQQQSQAQQQVQQQPQQQVQQPPQQQTQQQQQSSWNFNQYENGSTWTF